MSAIVNSRDLAIQAGTRTTYATGYSAVSLVLLTSSNIASADSTGTVTTLPSGNIASLYVGGVKLTSGVTFGLSGSTTSNGVTISISSSTGAITLTGTWSTSSDMEVFYITATYNTIVYTTQYTIIKSKKGTDGSSGSSFYALAITVYQQASTIPNSPSGGSYVFTGDTFTSPSGWTRSMPTSSTIPTWASTYLFETATPTIAVIGPVGGGSAGDPNFSSVVLLAHMNGVNNGTTIVDSGPYGIALTVGGTAVTSTTTYQFGTASLKTDGTSTAMVTGTSPTNLVLPGTYTLEFWCKLNSTSTGDFVRIGNETANRITFYVLSGTISTNIYNDSTYPGYGSITANTWTHLAFVRVGNTITVYTNGVNTGSYTNAGYYGATHGNNGLITIGKNVDGYIDEVRISKGIARYTANFVPSTISFPDSVNGTSADPYYYGPTNDPYFSNVVLLLHFDGANGGTTFTDSSTYARTVSANGAITLSTAQSKFGTASLACGSNYVEPATSTDFLFPGDFTVECYLWTSNSSPDSQRPIEIQGTNGVTLWFSGGGLNVIFTSNTRITAANYFSSLTSQWVHTAVVCQGNTLTLYRNGTAVGTPYTAARLSDSGGQHVSIGSMQGGNQPWVGYIDDVRITVGIARYTGNFIVPTAAFPNTLETGSLAHTVLSLHGETLVDSSSQPKSLTAVSTVGVSTLQHKFGTSAIKFNGTTEYITTLNYSDFQFNTGDFTVEAWVYPSSIIGDQAIVGKDWSYGTYWPAWSLYITGATLGCQVGFASGPSTTGVSISGGTININTWNHAVLTRTGTTMYLLLNGILVGTVACSQNIINAYAGTYGLSIGAAINGNAKLTGYIDDLRITAGVLRYNINFTPSTTAFPNSVAAGDSSYANNISLLHFDGANNATTFTDSSTASCTLTAVSGAKLTTSNFKYGTASLLLNGTTDYVTFNSPTSQDLGSGDYTIEAWIYPTSAAPSGTEGRWIFSSAGPNATNFAALDLIITTGGFIRANIRTVSGGTGINVSTTIAVTINSWSHVALTRQSGTAYLWINGVVSGIYPGWPDYPIASQNFAAIGAIANGYTSTVNRFQGQIDEFRITKGTARYMAGFTLPTEQFPDAYVLGGWPTPIKVYQDGTGGSTLSLSYTAQAFTFDTTGSASPSSQTVTFTANLAGGLSGTATFTVNLYNASGTQTGITTPTPTMGGSGNIRTLTNTQFDNAAFAVVTASLSGYTDQATVVRLKDGAAGVASVTGLLTNESTNVAADSAGAVASFSGTGGTFMVFDGITDKTGNAAVTYSVSGSPTGGLSISIASTGVYTITALTSDRGTALLQAVYGGVTLNKLFDISKSRAGTSVTLLTLTPETISLAADSTGFVSSYSAAQTTAMVWNGNTDDTSNWTLSIATGTGVTATLSGTQALVSAMTADTGYVSVTATRTGYTSLTKRFNLVKARSSGTTAGVVTGFSFNSACLSATTSAQAAVRFNNDGTVDAKDNTSTYRAAGNWYAPTTSGIGASYWIKAVVSSGSVSGGTTGSVLAMPQSWNCLVSSSSHVVANADLAITIYLDAAGTMPVATGTVSLDAETPPYP